VTGARNGGEERHCSYAFQGGMAREAGMLAASPAFLTLHCCSLSSAPCFVE
jgi:hypothetical protein